MPAAGVTNARLCAVSSAVTKNSLNCPKIGTRHKRHCCLCSADMDSSTRRNTFERLRRGMKTAEQFRRLEDRLTAYGPDVASVIKRVLFEEQRKLGLKNPKDIVTIVERIIDESAADE